MARARNIKPSLFKNEILGTIDPLITLLFEGLWCLADREGRLEDRPLRIKAEIFPYRENLDINGYLTVLEQHDFIRRYKSAGIGYIQVTKFKEHQSPHNTEKPSKLPPYEAVIVDSIGSKEITVNSPLNNDGLTTALPPDSLIPDSLIPDHHAISISESGCDDDHFSDRLPNNAHPEAQLCAALRPLGVQATPANPFVIAWVSDGITLTQLLEAVSRARLAKPSPAPIPVRYLDTTVRGMIAEAAKPKPPPKFDPVAYVNRHRKPDCENENEHEIIDITPRNPMVGNPSETGD